MSRVGRKLIKIPAGVTIECGENGKGFISVKGPNGVLRQELKEPIGVEVSGDTLTVNRGNDENKTKALHGLYNRLIGNMIAGVTKGFTKTLLLNGVGYKVALKGEGLTLNLGMSHAVEIPATAGIKLKVLSPQDIAALALPKDQVCTAVVQVMGASKEQVGLVASKIRDVRPVEPYHLYGVRYLDEHVTRKESKSGAKGKKK